MREPVYWRVTMTFDSLDAAAKAWRDTKTNDSVASVCSALDSEREIIPWTEGFTERLERALVDTDLDAA